MNRFKYYKQIIQFVIFCFHTFKWFKVLSMIEKLCLTHRWDPKNITTPGLSGPDINANE